MKIRHYIPASRYPDLAYLPPDDAEALLKRCLETPAAKAVSRRCDLRINTSAIFSYLVHGIL